MFTQNSLCGETLFLPEIANNVCTDLPDKFEAWMNAKSTFGEKTI